MEYETNEKYVNLNYDCGHFYMAGDNPLNAIQKYIDRTTHIHFKDVRELIKQKVFNEKLSFLEGVKLGVFTVPGDGDIENMDEILSYIKNQNYKIKIYENLLDGSEHFALVKGKIKRGITPRLRVISSNVMQNYLLNQKLPNSFNKTLNLSLIHI